MKSKIIQIKAILIVLLLCCITTSCSIDDIKPEHKLTDENVIRDAKSAQQVLNGIYDLWRQFDLGFFPIHLTALGTTGQIIGSIKGDKGVNNNELPVMNPYLASIYNEHYKIINDANFLIQKLNEGAAKDITETKKNELVAQAKFNRALAYFQLLKYFGQFYDLSSPYGVVIKTKFSTEKEAKARSSVQEVYDLIVKDLKFAVQNGPKNVAHYYAGSLAAKALLSKVDLYIGNYKESATLANEVIHNSEGYTLESSYSAIYNNTYNSSEAIFVLYHSLEEGGSAMDQINRSSYSANFEALADAQVSGTGDLTGAGQGFDPRFLYAYSDATKGQNQMGKYPFFSTTQKNTNFYLRLGEIYLIYAEAEARRTGGDLNAALTALNTIRDRAGVAPKTLTSKKQLLEDIREEKRLELFFETGETWFDLIRYDILGDIDAFSLKPSLTSKTQFTLPIPLKVKTGNKLLEQNPGY